MTPGAAVRSREFFPLSPFARMLLVYGGAAGAALVAGVVSGSSRLSLVAVLAGMIGAVALALSRRALLWAVVLGGLIVTGVTQLYLPEIKFIKFVFPLAALLLFFHGVMDRIAERPAMVRPVRCGILFWLSAFLLVAALSAIANWDPGVAALGFKSYFPMWILVFALALSRFAVEDFDGLLKAMLAIALLQLPFVLHQYLTLVPLRQNLGPGIIPVDILVGTFGGNALGGGANAVLALFVFVVFACLLGLWKHGALSGFRTALFGLPIITPVFFNEAKVSVFYLPVIVLVLFYADIIRRPLRLLLVTGIGAGLFAGLMTAMTVFHPGGDLRGWSDLVDITYRQQIADVTELRGQHSELTRWTALTFWAKENAGAHPVNLLIGYGPGASRMPEEGEWTLTRTLAERRYHDGMRIGYTALSAILWDTGVLGLIAILGVFAAAYRTAGRLAIAWAPHSRFRAGIFDGLKAASCLLVISLAHKDFFVLHLPYQTLVFLILGYLLVAQYRLARDDRFDVASWAENAPARLPTDTDRRRDGGGGGS